MPKNRIPDSIRQRCFERDQYTCQHPGCNFSQNNGHTIHLHHILPEQFGGKETESNLITLCDIHHKSKHIEFHAYYADSRGIIIKMIGFMKEALSSIRKTFNIDDGYDLEYVLKYLSGSTKFRPGQLKVIRAALSGKNVLFVAPTGVGKSVCYQLPGLLGEHPSLVISPLKALMKDQVESIWSKIIPATYINSDLSEQEKSKRYEYIKERLFKFIFVAPERFDSRDINTSCLYSKYSHLVIDEAHEIEMWGMAFRPAYRKLGVLREKLDMPPLIALTATASKQTQQLILDSLNARDAKVIVTGFFRNNIQIQIYQTGVDFDKKFGMNKYDYILEIIRENPNQKTLIFVLTVGEGEHLLELLISNGIEADFYHSRLDQNIKMHLQNRFTGIEQPELKILISTSAFGMGIDIPDIRHVIHLSPALSITDYVQQIGRAGRDRRQSYAHLMYHPDDDKLLYFMAELPLKNSNFKEQHQYTEADVQQVKLKLRSQVNDMLSLIKQPKGKEWQYILDYFGEAQPSFWERNGKDIVDLGLFIGIGYLLLKLFELMLVILSWL